MILAPSGNLSTSLFLFRELMAIGTKFKAWSKQPTTAQAMTRAYGLGTFTRTRPCVMVGWKSGSYRQPEGWSGLVQAIFEADTGTAFRPGGLDEGSLERAAYEFTNHFGPIIEEMMDNQHTTSSLGTTYPVIDINRGIQFASGIARGDITCPTDFHQWTVMVPWGLK